MGLPPISAIIWDDLVSLADQGTIDLDGGESGSAGQNGDGSTHFGFTAAFGWLFSTVQTVKMETGQNDDGSPQFGVNCI